MFPAGGSVDIGLDEPFAENDFYFAALMFSGTKRVIMDRPVVLTRQSSEVDPIVKKGLLKKDRTSITLQVPEILSAPWQQAKLYIFTCQGGSPFKVSEASVRVSPSLFSSLFAIASVLLGFFVASVAFRAERPQRMIQYLNPIPLTAGTDGRASLGKFQVLMFSLIVFGLITYFLLRTGLLSDISSTVLLLIGIAGVGSTAAKGADLSRTTLTTENRAWLLRKRWLPSMTNPVSADAHWRDLFTTEGEFDVYRYQSFIFSLVVGGALIIGGVSQLSSFEIPTTLLGILGLSQVVYVGGKLVTPTSISDLNKAMDELRDAEKKFRSAAIAANNGQTPSSLTQAIQPNSQNSYDAYMSLAADVATLFTNQTGKIVPLQVQQPTF